MTFYLLGLALFWAVMATLALVWAERSGQFRDVEAVKYRMLAAGPPGSPVVTSSQGQQIGTDEPA